MPAVLGAVFSGRRLFFPSTLSYNTKFTGFGGKVA